MESPIPAPVTPRPTLFRQEAVEARRVSLVGEALQANPISYPLLAGTSIVSTERASTQTSQARATAVDCVGTVSKVLLYADGTVNIMGSWRGDCSTTGSYGSHVPVEDCLIWYALLTKAKTDNLNVTIYYNKNTACTALPTYQSTPVPLYVGLY